MAFTSYHKLRMSTKHLFVKAFISKGPYCCHLAIKSQKPGMQLGSVDF